MHTAELDTFVHKFRQLWNAGPNAHLDFDCRGGAAFVGLRLELGHAPGPAHHQVDPFYLHRRSYSPAYQRRRARRSAARANSNNDTVEVSNHEECVDRNKNDNHAEVASSDDRETGTEGLNESKEKNIKEKDNIVEAVEAFQENDNDTNHKDDEHATEDENMVNTVVTNEIPVQRNNEERTSNDEVEKDDDEPRQISQ